MPERKLLYISYVPVESLDCFINILSYDSRIYLVYMRCLLGQNFSPQTSQSPLLYFSQGSTATHKGDGSHGRSGGESLEEVPAVVVEKEDALKHDDGAKEDRM